MAKKYYDGAIAAGKDGLSCIVRKENNPPPVASWGTADDTLVRQAGHGICKGLATAWVIALLSGQKEAHEKGSFRKYFTEVLKFQGTYIKDFGQHMDGHVKQLKKMSADPGVRLLKKITPKTLEMSDVPSGNWGAYVSVWKHDVAFGSYNNKYYVMDPNCGLIGFSNKWKFVAGAQSLVEGRRTRKNKGPDDTIGIWFYA